MIPRDPTHSHVVFAAVALISAAAGRMMNDQPPTPPMSPERRRWTETWTMLSDAMALLRPDDVHLDDRPEVERLIADLERMTPQQVAGYVRCRLGAQAKGDR